MAIDPSFLSPFSRLVMVIAADTSGIDRKVHTQMKVFLAALAIAYDGINYTATNRVHQRRGFSSNHVGGAQFTLCDGSVRFISQNIDYTKLSVTVAPYPAGFVTTTLARLLCRNDGQVIGEF